MKTKTLAVKLLVAAFALHSSLAVALFEPKIGGGLWMARIKELKIVQIGLIPTVIVTAAGDKYDTVNPQGFVVNYQLNADCKGLWKLHWLKADMSSPGGYGYTTVPKGNDPNAMFSEVFIPHNTNSHDNKRQFTSSFGAVIVPDDIANDAIQQCNDNATTRMQQTGKKRVQVMTEPQLIKAIDRSYAKSELEAWLLCGRILGDENNHQNDSIAFTRGSQKVKVDYQCKAKPLARPTTPFGDIKTLPSVQSISLSKPIPTGNIAVTCPAEVGLSASVKVTGGNDVPVKYRWRRSDGYVSGVFNGTTSKTLNIEMLSTSHKFSVGETKKLGNSKGMTQSGLGKVGNGLANVHHGWVQLEVLEPTNKASDKKPYSVKCKVKKPDLVVSKFVVAGKTPQQGAIELKPSDALSKGANGCSFPVSYLAGNIGGADVLAAFSNRLKSGTKTIGADSTQAFSGPTSAPQTAKVTLKNGLHSVSLNLDSLSKITELNESNNSALVRAVVSGCGG